MNASESSRFYANLPVLDSFFNVSNRDHYHPLPGDWYVGITDIQNSTEAIENDQYKRVNILGASPIVGLLNKSDKDRLPYSFGGDGCAICFPPEMLEPARTVFAASQQIGNEQFNLKLRAAIIPVSHIRQNGFDIQVARFRITNSYSQAVFVGGGLNHAEALLKADKSSSFHIIPDKNANITDADFTGLECRWQKVYPPKKVVISMLIQANPYSESTGKVYDEVLNKMADIFGFDDQTNPISTSQLNMNFSAQNLMDEVQFRTFGKSWPEQLVYLLKIELQTLLGKAFMYFGHTSSETNWSRYKADLAANSDHRKFDDMLRLVISGTQIQVDKLNRFLDQKFEDSQLAYGIHTAEAAVVTCMVFAYHRDHIHFVDGHGGGYVEASKALKRRLNELKQ